MTSPQRSPTLIGWRLLAQSLAPGVMQQQSSAIVYGISDADKALRQDTGLSALLEKVAPQIHTRPQQVSPALL